MFCSLRNKNYLLLFILFLSKWANAQVVTKKDFLQKNKPTFNQHKYRATIDILNKHLSGILLFTTIDTNEIRSVFVNEMGVTFFDMSLYNDHYIFHKVIEGMDKRAVKKSLGKTLGMICMQGIFDKKDLDNVVSINTNNTIQTLNIKLKGNGAVMYKWDAMQKRIDEIDNVGRRKKVVNIAQYYTMNKPIPDSIFVTHYNVHFNISLKEIHAQE